jgi:hypothetical protein
MTIQGKKRSLKMWNGGMRSRSRSRSRSRTPSRVGLSPRKTNAGDDDILSGRSFGSISLSRRRDDTLDESIIRTIIIEELDITNDDIDDYISNMKHDRDSNVYRTGPLQRLIESNPRTMNADVRRFVSGLVSYLEDEKDMVFGSLNRRIHAIQRRLFVNDISTDTEFTKGGNRHRPRPRDSRIHSYNTRYTRKHKQ